MVLVKNGFLFLTIFLLLSHTSFAENEAMRFIWCGKRHPPWPENDGNPVYQFAPDEIDYIAENHSLFVLSKFHGQPAVDIQIHHEAAELVKSVNPSIEVYPYFSASVWLTGGIGIAYCEYPYERPFNYWYVLRTLDNLYLERDPEDIGITCSSCNPRMPQAWLRKKMSRDGADVWWTDLDHSNFHFWARDVVISPWMLLDLPDGSPLYDGIAVDNAKPMDVVTPSQTVISLAKKIGGYDKENYPDIFSLFIQEEISHAEALGLVKLEEWNQGLRSFLYKLKKHIDSLGRDQRIIVNGLRDGAWDRVEDIEDLLRRSFSDFIMNEGFGYSNRTLVHPDTMAYYIDLMRDSRFKGKKWLQKSNIGAEDLVLSQEEINRALRWSFGWFLLGWIPNQSFFKAALWSGDESFYDIAGNLYFDPPEINLDIGLPVEEPRLLVNMVYRRRYSNGAVYVNSDPEITRSLRPPPGYTNWTGGMPGDEYDGMKRLKLRPYEAAFFLKSGM
jgi:hypothetical protein